MTYKIIYFLISNHNEYKDKLQPYTIEILDKFIEKMDDEDEFTDKEHKIKYPNFKQFKINLIKLMIYNEKVKVVNVICDKVELPK